MVFNNDLLFIHVPKTAGMAVTEALLRALPRPVYYAVQAGHADEQTDVQVVDGRRHQRLADVDAWFEAQSLPHRLASFRHVLVMVRNPYALEVSRYHYLQGGHSWDAGEAQTLALAGDFAAFVRGSQWWFRFEDYYTVNGYLPDNLRILRQESFVPELGAYCADVGSEDLELAARNISGSGDYRDLMTPELEPLVYQKYRYLFEKGFYSREDFSIVEEPPAPDPEALADGLELPAAHPDGPSDDPTPGPGATPEDQEAPLRSAEVLPPCD